MSGLDKVRHGDMSTLLNPNIRMVVINWKLRIVSRYDNLQESPSLGKQGRVAVQREKAFYGE